MTLGVLAVAGCTTAPSQDVDAGLTFHDARVRDASVSVAVDAAPMTSTCAEIGPVNLTGISGDYGTFGGTSSIIYNMLWVKFGNPAVNVVGLEGYGSRSTLMGVNADLASTANRNYRDCTHCILVYRNCTFATSGTTCAEGPYYQRQGTGSFTQFADTSGGSFSGSFSNVTVEEVNMNQTTGETTPVVGGNCLHISNLSLGGTVTAAGSSAGGTESGLRQTAAGVAYYNTCTVMTDCTGTPKCLGISSATLRVCSQVCSSDVDCPQSGICVKFGTTNPVGNCMRACPTGGCGTGLSCHNYQRLSNSASVNVCAPTDW